MSAVAVWCAAVLAGVFAVSAVAKLRDPAAFRAAVRAFGVPAAAVGPVARAVPVGEAVVAVLLVPPPTRAVALVAAALLLVAFSVGIVRVLRRGVPTRCACFGRSGAPVAPRHVVRNAALVAVAGLGLAAGGVAPDPLATVVAVLAAVPVVAVVVVLDDLAAVLAPPAPTRR